MNVIDLCEHGYIPDILARAGMRSLMQQRLVEEASHDGEVRAQRFNRFLDELRASPIAVETKAANQQHYEVPAEFFHLHLGPRLKYSCCLYPAGTETLAQAGEAMLALYAERAGLRDGMRILDLGCGWGSLSACPIRMGNANSSRGAPPSAASATSASSPATSSISTFPPRAWARLSPADSTVCCRSRCSSI